VPGVAKIGTPAAASDVDRGVLDLDLVQGREPRRLGEQSSRHREQQVLQRAQRQPGPATLGWLVGSHTLGCATPVASPQRDGRLVTYLATFEY
jgi:hypothetical protein